MREAKERPSDEHGYSVKVFWSGEDEAFIAVCPELKNLSAFGATREDALRELDVAIEAALAVYREEGWPIPAPAGSADYSGQFRARLPKNLHRQLAETAEQEGVSLNTLVVDLLGQGVGRRDLVSSRATFSDRRNRVVSLRSDVVRRGRDMGRFVVKGRDGQGPSTTVIRGGRKGSAGARKGGKKR